jgi:hypothetical protein
LAASESGRPEYSVQDVLCSNVSVGEAVSFFSGELQNFFRVSTQRNLRRSRDGRASFDKPLNFSTDFCARLDWAGVAMHQSDVFAQEAEEDVLGVNGGTSILARFIAREENDAAGFLGEALEHCE